MTQIPISLFGDSGYALPRFGLGLAALGRPGYINLGHGSDLKYQYGLEQMEQNTYKMLEYAHSLGLRYFDAAQSYGRSEKFLGNWLSTTNVAIKDVFIGSKWGYTYVANWQVQATHHEIKEHSIEVLKRQWKFSSSTLEPNLKLYQIHSATIQSGVLSNFKVLDYLAELKSEGYLIGLTLSGVDQEAVLSQALKISVEEEKLFDTVQLTYNLFERSCEHVLVKAHDQGVAVIIKEALANGRLTARNADTTMSEQMSILNEVALEYDVGYDAIALAYLNKSPHLSMILSGAATQEHLKSNCNGFSIDLSAQDMRRLDRMRISSNKYWTDRKNMVWN